jgi:prepilin-type N-terminal cleavage/methylation domain-containing protein
MSVKKTLGRFWSGFSTIELIVVLAIIGMLMAIALPTYMNIVPRRELKADAQAIKQVLQKARMSASMYQRPIRVLVDCTDDTLQGASRPCRLEAQVPAFNANGSIKSWTQLSGSRVELHKNTAVAYESSSALKRARFDNYSGLFEGFYSVSGNGPRSYGVASKDGFAEDSFVIVFTPSGEGISYCPITMRITSRALEQVNANAWLLSLINSTGHVRLIQAT